MLGGAPHPDLRVSRWPVRGRGRATSAAVCAVDDRCGNPLPHGARTAHRPASDRGRSSSSPARCASSAACTRLVTRSLVRTALTWSFTVPHDTARGQGAHQVGELVGLGVLEEEAGRAGVQRGQDVLVGVERGQHRHHRRIGHRAQLAQDGEPVDVRHPDVQQHHVGSLPADGPHRVAAARGRDDLDVLGRAENEFEARADQCLVTVGWHPPVGRGTAPGRRGVPRTKRRSAQGVGVGAEPWRRWRWVYAVIACHRWRRSVSGQRSGVKCSSA
ncbi:hypothetical protein SCNRRL3882_5497 [Streptomyces chartreusis NRRL 3882]|uniref:Uncharacterized protein n=1 Tax=Streptomyces chartreusis NRRL 3882 TaxID=1079985 RepID=A0A2N9BF96_STRCX|nr:hypothetical protein SCNRRL3882_5497 [Streptomyces chartreusis NRRL 3882]